MDLEYFKTIFAQRFNDIFMQKWFEDISGNSQCYTYKSFKESLKMEEYLTLLDTADKHIITKFRTGTYHLPVTNRRFHQKIIPVPCVQRVKLEMNPIIYLNVYSLKKTGKSSFLNPFLNCQMISLFITSLIVVRKDWLRQLNLPKS